MSTIADSDVMDITMKTLDIMGNKISEENISNSDRRG